MTIYKNGKKIAGDYSDLYLRKTGDPEKSDIDYIFTGNLSGGNWGISPEGFITAAGFSGSNYTGLPVASGQKQGIASFNPDLFIVTDGHVNLNTEVLGTTLGKTFVDIATNQTITGTKTFSSTLIAQAIDSNTRIAVGAKKDINDGLVGTIVASTGNIYLTTKANLDPYIYFFRHESKSETASISGRINGICTSGSFMTHSKTAHNDGKAGVMLRAGIVDIISEGGNASIYFYNNGSTTVNNILSGGTNLNSSTSFRSAVNLYAGGAVYSGNKVASNDTTPGAILGSTGMVHIASETNPCINFYNNLSSSISNTLSSTSEGIITSGIFRSGSHTYTGGNIYTNGKQLASDGLSGTICSDGAVYICSASNPTIQFYRASSTTPSGSITLTNIGYRFSSHLLSTINGGNNIGASNAQWFNGYLSNALLIGAGKSETNDGIAGLLASYNGNLYLTSNTNPAIYTYSANATSATGSLVMSPTDITYNGISLLSGNVKALQEVKTEVDILEDKIAELENEIKELKNQLSN
ncbi:MAG: hypothetical protein LUH10_00545 [Tannerellaceae bacterium]|nr:hypothetical protein [Tannerellaceae bacterium]